MRIGQVNQDNYKEMLKLFGGNNSKSLENLLGKGENNKFAKTEEERNAMLVKMGYMEEGMLIREGDTSWKKTVAVSDEIKNKLIETARSQFTTNANGMFEARDGDEIGAIMKEYRTNIPPSERLPVTWTLIQIVQQENQRMIDHVKSKIPGWQPGQSFDKSIFDDYVSGGLDIKA